MTAKPSSLLIGASRWRRSPRSPKTISRTLFWSTVGRLARTAACFPWKPISPAVDRDAVTDNLRTLAERYTGAPPRVKKLTGVGNSLYRLRSGDYLVLYRIDEALVTVMRVINWEISSGPSGDSEAKSEYNTADRRSQPVALRRPPANFRDRAELFVATSWSSPRARFTELLSGNTRATSGSKRTKFVPAVARW